MEKQINSVMNENEKIRFAQKILSLLEINISEGEKMDSLLPKVRTAIVLPASQTEGEIMILANQIADKLESTSSREIVITALYEKLYHEVTYLPFE